MATMIIIPKHKRSMPKRKPLAAMEGFSDEPEESSMNSIMVPKGAEPLKPGEKREVVIEVEGGEEGMAKITKYNGIPMDGSADDKGDEGEGEDEPPKDGSFVGAAMGPEEGGE